MFDGNNQLLLFGGALSNNSLVDETWLWDGQNWSRKLPATSPLARIFASSTYDVSTMQVVLFGGDSNAFTHILLNDTWVWPTSALCDGGERFDNPPAEDLPTYSYGPDGFSAVSFQVFGAKYDD